MSSTIELSNILMSLIWFSGILGDRFEREYFGIKELK